MSYKISNEIKEQTILMMQSELDKQNKTQFTFSKNRLLVASLSIALIGVITLNTSITQSKLTNTLPANDVVFNSENTSSDITPIPKSYEDMSIEIYSKLKEMVISKPLDDWEYSYISQGFKVGSHEAYDIIKTINSPIYSFSDGTVISAEYAGSYGNLIIIDHGNGISSYYAHCKDLLVENGDTINAGDIIGTVGTTGNSNHYHLHFETRYNNDTFDILDFLDYKTFELLNAYIEDEYQKYLTKILEYDKNYSPSTPFEHYTTNDINNLSALDMETIRINHAKEYYEFILETEIPPLTQAQHDQLQQKFDTIQLTNPLNSWDYISLPYYQDIYECFGAPAIHRAYDIPNEKGSNIYSIADGIVISNEYHKKYGNLLVIDHGDEFVSYYAHCNDITVKSGDSVKSGDIVATVGTTGASTGPHLHFEVKYQNTPFDITTFKFTDKTLFNFT